jgi:hypothetical protein
MIAVLKVEKMNNNNNNNNSVVSSFSVGLNREVFVGSLFYGAFSVTRKYSVDDRVTSEL